MNAFLVAVLASTVVLVSALNPPNYKNGLSARLLVPDEVLRTLLSTQDSSIGGGDSQVPVGLLQYNFNRDYQRINPRNPASDWKFLSVESNNGKYVADSGTLLRDGISSVELVSVPFRKFLPREAGRLALLTNYEAVLANKIKFVVEPEHKLTVRAVFSVQIKNVEDQPFGRTAVTNATDDPSLISGGISLASSGKGGLVFSIVATEKGIWAVYERNRIGLVQHPEREDKLFTIFHRLADRISEAEEIDAAITYDRSQNAVHFKLNNVVVHTIKNLGTLPVKEVGTLAYTLSRPDLVPVEPKEFTVLVGLLSMLDTQDPNAQAHSLHNQRMTSEDVYDVKAKFQDETANSMYKLWGQGAILKLHDIVIQLEESKKENINENDKGDLNARSNKDETNNENTDDGKLIVSDPAVDTEEVVKLVGGERAPRIEQGEGEAEEVAVDEEKTSDAVEEMEGNVRTGRGTRQQLPSDELVAGELEKEKVALQTDSHNGQPSTGARGRGRRF